MIRNRYLLPGILFVLALVSMACTQQRQPCLTPKTASLIIGAIHFKTDTSTVPVDTVLPHATFYPVSSQQNFVTVYPPQASFTVSLSPDTGYCQWLFETDSLKHTPDTVSFYYQRNAKFLSNACGFTYFYSIDSIHTTHLIIDSLRILNNSVTNNVNTKHLQIYIHRSF